MAVSGKRQAKIELNLDAKRLEGQIAIAKKSLRNFAVGVPKNMAKAGVGMAKNLGVGFGIQTANAMTSFAGDLIDVERGLIRYQLASSSSDTEMQSFRASLIDISNNAGVARGELLKGAAAYVAFTGDSKGAASSMQLFADVANATGATMEDIAGVAGALKENLKMDPKEFRAGFDMLITQGKLGAVEIKNLATEISNVAPMFAKFAGGSGQEGLARMGAIMQMMRKDFGSVEETATGFKGIMSQMARKASDLKKIGVNVFDPKNKNQMRSFLDIVDELKKKRDEGKVNAASLIDLLGEQKAVNALNAVMDRRGELNQMIIDAQNSNAVAKDAMKYQESAAGKIDKAWNSIRNKIAEALTPERIDKMANALVNAADLFSGLVDKVSQIVGFIADHLPSYEKNAAKAEAGMGVDVAGGIAQLEARGMSKRDATAKFMEISGNMSRALGGGLTNDGRQDGKAMAYIAAEQQARTMLRKMDNPLFAADMLAISADQRKVSTLPSADIRARAFEDDQRKTSSLHRPSFLSGEAPINLTVKLGDNVIAESLANSTVARTKPGGR